VTPAIRHAAAAVAAALAMTLIGTSPVRAQSPGAENASDPVVAIVDEIEIRRSDLVMLHATLPAQYRKVPMQMIERQLLDRLIDRAVLARAARRAGLADTDKVKRRLAFVAQGVLQEAYLQDRIEAAFTDERLRAAYDRMIAERKPEEEVRASHILLRTEEEAKRVIAVLEGGADFEETAKAESIGPSAAKGGDLGYFTRGQMVAEFAEAAFALSVGGISAEPVKTEFGWHVIKVVDRREAPAPSFEESLNELRSTIAREVIAETIAALRDAADIRLIAGDGAPAGKKGEGAKSD